jgi:hypothetical protein
MKMRRAAALLLVLLLLPLAAACTNTLAARQAQLQPLVGQTELDLVQAMGVPTRTYQTDGVKFLSYQQQQTQVIPATPWYWNGPFPGFYGGFPPQVVTWACDTTFAVADGRVTSFTLRGNGCG